MRSMKRLTLLLAAAAALATPASASAFTFRVVTLDFSIDHADDWRAGGTTGRQAFTFSTPHPVRQSIVVYKSGRPPFQTMSNDELVFDPPRATVRRTVDGAAPCPVTRPRVRTHFAVEDDFQLQVGNVARLAEPCPPAAADLQLAPPPTIVFDGGARKIRRLKRGGKVTLRARLEQGTDEQGAVVDGCTPPPADGSWECATTSATVKVRRVE
jgi:hypothetical protein